MRIQLAALLAVLTLFAAACGDDDEGASAPEPEPEPAAKASDRAGVDVTGQETVLVTSESLRSALEEQGIRLEPIGATKTTGDGIELPITGGRVSLDDGGGTVGHSGGFAFAGGPKDGRVEVRDLFLDTRSGTAYGVIGGSRVRFLRIDTSGLEVQKGEDHLVAGDLDAKLASDGAAVLQEELGAELEAGQEIGSLRVRLAPRLPDAAGAPDASAELQDLEDRARALAEQAEELSPEDRERLDDARRLIEEALSGS